MSYDNPDGSGYGWCMTAEMSEHYHLEDIKDLVGDPADFTPGDWSRLYLLWDEHRPPITVASIGNVRVIVRGFGSRHMMAPLRDGAVMPGLTFELLPGLWHERPPGDLYAGGVWLKDPMTRPEYVETPEEIAELTFEERLARYKNRCRT